MFFEHSVAKKSTKISEIGCLVIQLVILSIRPWKKKKEKEKEKEKKETLFYGRTDLSSGLFSKNFLYFDQNGRFYMIFNSKQKKISQIGKI